MLKDSNIRFCITPNFFALTFVIQCACPADETESLYFPLLILLLSTDLSEVIDEQDGAVQMITDMAGEAYEQAAAGVSHLYQMQEQYIAARRDRKHAAIAAAATLLLMAGVYIYAYSSVANVDSGDSTGPPEKNGP